MTLSLSIIKQFCLVLWEHSLKLVFTKYGATLSLERIPRGSMATSRWPGGHETTASFPFLLNNLPPTRTAIAMNQFTCLPTHESKNICPHSDQGFSRKR